MARPVILADANVFEDIVRLRKGYPASVAVWRKVKSGEIEGGVSAWTVAVVYYFRRRQGLTDDQARQKVRASIHNARFRVWALTPDIVQSALDEKRIPDFEDALQFHTAKSNKAEVIVTRNLKDFAGVKSEIPVMTPEDYLRQLAELNKGQP